MPLRLLTVVTHKVPSVVAMSMLPLFAVVRAATDVVPDAVPVMNWSPADEA